MHRGPSLLLILCALAPHVPEPASGGWPNLCTRLPLPFFLQPQPLLYAPRAGPAYPEIRDQPGSYWQLREAAPNREPSFSCPLSWHPGLAPGVSLHSSGFSFLDARASLSASLRGERSSEWAGRFARDTASYTLLRVTLLESKLARTLLGTSPDRSSTGVRRCSSQLGGRGGLGPYCPCISCFPLPPSVQGRGMGSQSFFLRPGLTLPAPPGRPASDEPLASIQALVWPRPAMQGASGESRAAGLGL